MAKHFRLSSGTGSTPNVRRSSICQKYEEDWQSVGGTTHSEEGQGSAQLDELPGLPQQVSEWTAAHVQGWALSLGVPPEAALQLKLQRVNGRTLQKLSAVDLLAMGFDKIGHLRQVLEGRQDLFGRMSTAHSARSECRPGEDAELEGLNSTGVASTASVATTVPPGLGLEKLSTAVPFAQSPSDMKEPSKHGCPAFGVPTPQRTSSARAHGLSRWSESPIIARHSEVTPTARSCVSRSSSAQSSSRGVLSGGGFQAVPLAQADNSNNRSAGEGKLVRSASSTARARRIPSTPTQAMRGAPVSATAGMPSNCRQTVVISTSPSAPCSPGATFRSQRQEDVRVAAALERLESQRRSVSAATGEPAQESQPQSMGCPVGRMPAQTKSWSPPCTAAAGSPATAAPATAASATAPAAGGPIFCHDSC